MAFNTEHQRNFPYSLKSVIEMKKQTISQTDKLKSFKVESVLFHACSAHLTHSG